MSALGGRRARTAPGTETRTLGSAGASGPVIDVRALSVAYATDAGAVRAVDQVDLQVEPGEFLGIVGESGCGKSTLLFGIAQLLSPPAAVTGGQVLFNGRNLVGLTDKALSHSRWKDYSIVMQSAMNALNPVKPISAQYKDALRAHGVHDTAEISERSARVLRLVGIDPVHLASYPHQLSGGMRQRAMIAMALLFTPELIIMDEPTSALDVVAQRSLMVQIKQLQQQFGFAVIFVTHDISLVNRFSDRLAVMYAGQIVEWSDTRQVIDRPRHPYTRALLDAFPSVRGPKVALSGIPGNPPNLAEMPAGCRFTPRCRYAQGVCAELEPPLFDLGGDRVRCLLYDEANPLGAPDGVSGGLPPAPDPSDPPPSPAASTVSSAPGTSAEARAAAMPAIAVAPAEAGAEPPGGARQDTSPLLEVAGLTRHFRLGGLLGGRSLHAVDAVDFTIGAGEIVGLVGESGSGKSTVARLIAMTYKPTAGTISFRGRPLEEVHGRRELFAYRGQVTMVFQDPFSSLSPSHRVRHGLLRTLKLRRPDLGRADRQSAAEAAFETVGLSPSFLAKYPYEMSGGQRQRVGFAQALVSRPSLILADEPVSMLDVSIRVGLLNLMNRLRRDAGLSFLYITHDIASARYVADRIIVMYGGRVIESGPTEEVLIHPRHPYTELLMSAVPDPREDVGVEGTAEVGEPPRVIDPPPGCRFRDRCPLAQEICARITPELVKTGTRHHVACHVRAPSPE